MDRTSARARLEEALQSTDLCSEERVRLLVYKAFQVSSHGSKEAPVDKHVLESRFREVWRFLSELRGVGVELAKDSAVEDDIEGKGWKVKEDTGTMRVLYRKGPEGTPLHTMCLEGFINGPLATALSVAYGVPYYQEWFPKFTVPTFRITHSQWIDQAKPGQVVASVRFKVAWPFAPREIVLEAYAVEYWAKDILLVLMKTLPPGPSPLSRNGPAIPPEEKGVTRMEVVGGYIFQQITPSQCYFRTIADIDLKLALVPAWVINFISRQLAGLGLKLFEKVVQDVTAAKDTKFVKVFQRQLETDPFLQQVKAGLSGPESAEAPQRNGIGAPGAGQESTPIKRVEVLGTGVGDSVEDRSRRESVSNVRSERETVLDAASTSKAGRRSRRREVESERIDGYEQAEGSGSGQAELRLSSDFAAVGRTVESSSTYVSARQSLTFAEGLGDSQHVQKSRVSSGSGDGVVGTRTPFEVGTGLSVTEVSEREADGMSAEVQRCGGVIDRAMLQFRARKSENAPSKHGYGDQRLESEGVTGHRARAIQVESEGTSTRVGLQSDGVRARVQNALNTLERACRLMRTLENG